MQHIFYLLFRSRDERDYFISSMRAQGVHTVFHYVPLHSSVAGRAYGKSCGNLAITNSVSDCLVRLPLYIDLDIEKVFSAAEHVLIKLRDKF